MNAEQSASRVAQQWVRVVETVSGSVANRCNVFMTIAEEKGE